MSEWLDEYKMKRKSDDIKICDTTEKFDPNNNAGFAFISQRVVARVLNLDDKYDCNSSIKFDSAYDLYDKNSYNNIDVKFTILNKKNYWQFNLKNKEIPDIYILLGFSPDKSDILHVWFVKYLDELLFNSSINKVKTVISITNSERGLKRAAPWEVDVEPYNNAYYSMSLDNCSVLRSDISNAKRKVNQRDIIDKPTEYEEYMKRLEEVKELRNSPKRVINYDDIDSMPNIDDEHKFLLKEIIRFMLENGRDPTNKDFKALNGYPNSAKFYKYYNNKYKWYKRGISAAIEQLWSYGSSRSLILPKTESINKITYAEKFAVFSRIEKNLIDKLGCQNSGKFKHKYRSVSCDEYGDMIFKFSSLNNNIWLFNLRKKLENNQNIDNFICVGTNHELTEIKHIWGIVGCNVNTIKNLKIYDTHGSLERLRQYDVTNSFNIDELIQ